MNNKYFAVFLPSFGIEEKNISPWRTDHEGLTIAFDFIIIADWRLTYVALGPCLCSMKVDIGICGCWFLASFMIYKTSLSLNHNTNCVSCAILPSYHYRTSCEQSSCPRANVRRLA
jgi:hypothetical protein